MRQVTESVPLEIGKTFYNTAVELIAAHNLSAATQWLRQAVELDSDNPPLWELLGLCQFSLGEFAAAQQAWRHGVACGTADGPSAQYLADLATADFKTITARFNRCLEQAAQRKIFSALLQLWPALESVPNLAGWNLAGLLLYQLGLKKNAARLWKQVLKQDRSNARAAYYLAEGKFGLLPYCIEKVILEVLLRCGKISGIMKFSA
jgi:tetratricopeptide (TPR) repeat protein